ncbi:MAG: hypothetical protein MZV63_67315 [Marinilabiliales bacterium]|nr:hypothetical protein [Marinilabiliales bacterium]
MGEFLDSIIKNDDLKLILLGNLGYFHDDPYTLFHWPIIQLPRGVTIQAEPVLSREVHRDSPTTWRHLSEITEERSCSAIR